MKYLVMECHPGYAVVLDEQGRFIKAANLHYEVGQTVTEIVEMQSVSPASRIRKPLLSLASLAACLLLAVFGLIRVDRTPIAHVYLAINPQVRIDVNRQDAAVGIAALNADGEALIDSYIYRHKDISLVLDDLADRAAEMGYLTEESTIGLAFDASADWTSGHAEVLRGSLQAHVAQSLPGVPVLLPGESAPKPQPSAEPTSEPTPQPSAEPTYEPAPEPTTQATYEPIVIPVEPHAGNTPNPTPAPTQAPISGNDGKSDYGETDYGDTDYGPDSDGVTDYDDGETDYDDTDYGAK